MVESGARCIGTNENWLLNLPATRASVPGKAVGRRRKDVALCTPLLVARRDGTGLDAARQQQEGAQAAGCGAQKPGSGHVDVSGRRAQSRYSRASAEASRVPACRAGRSEQSVYEDPRAAGCPCPTAQPGCLLSIGASAAPRRALPRQGGNFSS